LKAAKLIERKEYDKALENLFLAQVELNEEYSRFPEDNDKKILDDSKLTLYVLFATAYESSGRLKDAETALATVKNLSQHLNNQITPSSMNGAAKSATKDDGDFKSLAAASANSAPSSSRLSLTPVASNPKSYASDVSRKEQNRTVSLRRALFSPSPVLGERSGPLVMYRCPRSMTLSQKVVSAGVIVSGLPQEVMNTVCSLASSGQTLYRIVFRSTETLNNVAKGHWWHTITKDGFLTTGVSGADGFKDTAGLAEVGSSSLVPWWSHAISAVFNATGKLCQQLQFRQLQRALDTALDLVELSATIPLVAGLDAGIKLCQEFLRRVPMLVSDKQNLKSELVALRHKAEHTLAEAEIWLRETQKQMEAASSSLSSEDLKHLIHRCQVLWRIWIESHKLRLFVSYLELYTESLFRDNADLSKHLMQTFEENVDDLRQAGSTMAALRESMQRLCLESDKSLLNKLDNAWNAWRRQEEPAFSGWNAWENAQQEHLKHLLLSAEENVKHLARGSSSSLASSQTTDAEIEMPEEGIYLHYDPATGKSTLCFWEE
jgi:hypothetical protein